MSDEDREPAKHNALHFGQKPVAPIQSGLQGLLTCRRGARPEPQQSQALVEKGCGSLQAVSLNAPSGQLNRQCHTVKLSADAHNDWGFRVAEVKASAARYRALYEQLGRREFLKSRCGELWIIRRASESI